MIDSSEPKDGDFVAYVERLVRLPEGARLPAQDPAPGQVSRRKPQDDGMVRTIRDAPARAPRGAQIDETVRDAVRAIARILGRVATVMLIAGIGLLAISFADDPPFHVDPMAGAVLAVAGGLVRRLAARAA